MAEARRKRRVTVKDVEKAIKIRSKYITALERDAFDQIVGEAYVIGFLRTYAQWLEIDERPLLDLYRQQAASSGKGSPYGDAALPEEPPFAFRARLIFGAVALLVIILAAVKVFLR